MHDEDAKCLNYLNLCFLEYKRKGHSHTSKQQNDVLPYSDKFNVQIKPFQYKVKYRGKNVLIFSVFAVDVIISHSVDLPYNTYSTLFYLCTHSSTCVCIPLSKIDFCCCTIISVGVKIVAR